MRNTLEQGVAQPFRAASVKASRFYPAQDQEEAGHGEQREDASRDEDLRPAVSIDHDAGVENRERDGTVVAEPGDRRTRAFVPGVMGVSRFSEQRDLSDDLEWATAGQCILRDSRIARVEDIAHHFYDIRHVLAFDHHREAGTEIRGALYRGYPADFQANVRKAWADSGVPRARYLHNAIGLSSNELIIIQREGAIEEIAVALRDAGADQGIIPDNSGSIGCWAWWVNAYSGGIISPTVDYRPPGTSAIAFVLKGPRSVDLPGGSVSYSLA